MRCLIGIVMWGKWQWLGEGLRDRVCVCLFQLTYEFVSILIFPGTRVSFLYNSGPYI